MNGVLRCPEYTPCRVLAVQDGYAQKSREFLAQAREEFDKGDLVQASEKLWGAAAQVVKAVAERRGWRHDSHRALAQVVGQLVAETGDLTIGAAFQVAQGLHFNFYEDVQPRELIASSFGPVEEFLAKLDRL